MKLNFPKGLFLSGLIFLFSQACLATDGNRTGLDGPGEAEVVAGIGYHNTLFDSANNKCQHCHNDLYDTWKTSMHAQSWKDPIFQSKYQDFLRLQISKIGSIHPISGDEYLPGMVNKAAQVCIKCHAPTAYYSNDYNVVRKEVGDIDDDPAFYQQGQDAQSNLSLSDLSVPTVVSSMATTGMVYTVSYHIGHEHNQEGINCAFCHSMETVRMMQEDDYYGDGGEYTLVKPIKMGPNGQIVVDAGTTLDYSADASTFDMNAFFALIGPEKYLDFANTPTDSAFTALTPDTPLFDENKMADGRYTMKSIPTGYEEGSGLPYYTGGPFYGPFGVTGLSNSNPDDATDREALVNEHFIAATEAADGDKFTSEHHFAAYGKSLCLSCHQRSSLALNPEFDGIAGITEGDQFLELCSTWTAMSDGVGDNYQDTATAPKCQRCHMEPLTEMDGEAVTVLHQWDQPDELFTLADNPDLTEHFLPISDGGEVGPVAEGYLNNHAFMGANTKDFGTTKIKTGFESDMKARKLGNKGKKGKKGDKDKKAKKIVVDTKLLNKTAHMFPGAHPMRRVLTRVVVKDANGNTIPYASATGDSDFKTITNELATLEGDAIMDGFETVKVKYNGSRNLVMQGQTPHLDDEPVVSQMMDDVLVEWTSPDGTVEDCPDYEKGPYPTATGWAIKGCTTVKKIIDTDDNAYFTRIYGRETGKRKDGTHVIRPGFDSNIVADNRLEPNEFEKYKIFYDTRNVAWPVTVTYKVYYLKKGGNGKFPTDPATGFLKASTPAKAAIYEVYSKEVVIE